MIIKDITITTQSSGTISFIKDKTDKNENKLALSEETGQKRKYEESEWQPGMKYNQSESRPAEEKKGGGQKIRGTAMLIFAISVY